MQNVPEANVTDPSTEDQQPMPNVSEASVTDPSAEDQQPMLNVPEVSLHPLENIIGNGQQHDLEELDDIIGNIIRDLEITCDEGIELSAPHEVEVENLYYDGEIEGVNDIDIDMPLDALEIELENFLN